MSKMTKQKKIRILKVLAFVFCALMIVKILMAVGFIS